MTERVRLWTPSDDATFADLIAEGAKIATAARRVGMTAQQGRDRFRHFRRRLGEQAR